MHVWALVGIGGFIGAVLRHLVVVGLQGSGSALPWATLAVNALGSFALGFLMFSPAHPGLSGSETRAFVGIGIIGAFTTMSAFGYESMRMLEDGQLLRFSANVLLTLCLVMLAILLGKTLALRLAG